MIICPNCGESTQEKYRICPICKAELLLKGRYQLMKVLGENIGITYLAKDVSEMATFQQVVIKELTIKAVDQWKTEELFRREGHVLKRLSHPNIPTFIEQFTLQINRSPSYFLVMECIEGTPLHEENKIKNYTEEDIFQLLIDVLNTLQYLHQSQPPIIHRDIKPSNLIRRLDGRISLIDFGGVKDIVNPTMGSTVAGTFGYAPPEQLLGEACEESDLYSLGMTALVLLTKRDINDVSEQLNLSSFLYEFLSPKMLMLLDKSLAQNTKDRFQSAKEMLDFIQFKEIKETKFLTPQNSSNNQEINDFLYHYDELKGLWQNLKKKGLMKPQAINIISALFILLLLYGFDVRKVFYVFPIYLSLKIIPAISLAVTESNFLKLIKEAREKKLLPHIEKEAFYLIFQDFAKQNTLFHHTFNYEEDKYIKKYFAKHPEDFPNPLKQKLPSKEEKSNILNESKLMFYRRILHDYRGK